MDQIIAAHAYANNEVVYIAWDTDGRIDGCLGFEVIRVYLNDQDEETERRTCAAWVAFQGQTNKGWNPQDTSVWPVQKLSWRDLTVRQKRDALERRPDEVRLRYEIRPVADLRPGLEPVIPSASDTITVNGESIPAYQGPKRPLGYLSPATISNSVRITSRLGAFRSTFNQGILGAQWMRKILMKDGQIEEGELETRIMNPTDDLRAYLVGDVVALIKEVFARPSRFLLALYELDDPELIDLILEHRARLRLIFANSGVSKKTKEWDERNAPARQRLIDAGVDVQHRMFNNSTHIGHNKFLLHLDTECCIRLDLMVFKNEKTI